MDVTKPLKPGFFLPRSGRDDLWIGIKYEKIPDCCFMCGIIGHLARECNLPQTTLSNQFGVRFPAFGGWLCTDNLSNPPGIYEKKSSLSIVDSELNPMIGDDAQLPYSSTPAGPISRPTQDPLSKPTCVNTIGSASLGSTSTIGQNSNFVAPDTCDGGGHGWASSKGTSLPQELDVECRASTSLSNKLTRTEILNVRPLVSCIHALHNSCPILDAVVYNFGPDFEHFEPTRCLPYHPFQSTPHPGPNDIPEPKLYDIPVTIHCIEPITTEPNTPEQHTLPIIPKPRLLETEIPYHILKRKSPPPILTIEPKKPRLLSSVNPSRAEGSSSLPESLTVTTAHLLPVPPPIHSNTDFCSQNFSMAEEAGLIMPLSPP